MTKGTIAFYTLGCKLNFAETSSIAKSLTENGFVQTSFESKADVYVINTCSVTEQANKKCRNIVNRALRQNPNAFVAIIGCYAQLKPEEIATIPGVDLVLGASEKFNLVRLLDSIEKKQHAAIYSCDIKTLKEFNPSFSSGDRTRAFLKVQDGCDYFCSFCTIPLARGFSRSNSIEKTIQSVRNALQTGVKEIVLTGVNIGDFGKGNNESFYDLIQALESIPEQVRYRISSIEPNLLSKEIIDFVANSNKFTPHFHIPLQSGSDRILKLMRRRYESNLYKEKVNYIKEKLPNACIGVDVIVGFPGETENYFSETFDFLNSLPVSYLHVFTYSERENTTAIRFEDSVPMRIRRERNSVLTSLSERKKNEFYQSQVGKTVLVLFEHENIDGKMHGYSENYIRVEAPYESNIANSICPVYLDTYKENGIFTLNQLFEIA